jgi:hypothetical protein
MTRFLKHWRKIGFGKAFRAHVISYAAKVMAWTKATMTSTRPITVHSRRGLRKLSPDLISKAMDETATQVTRIGLTFLGTAAFCLLSLLSPDTALLEGSEKISVPFAGPVSFVGFMLLGPAVLIALRVYLEIYVEHSARLDRLARWVSAVRAPTVVPLDIPLIRLSKGGFEPSCGDNCRIHNDLFWSPGASFGFVSCKPVRTLAQGSESP